MYKLPPLLFFPLPVVFSLPVSASSFFRTSDDCPVLSALRLQLPEEQSSYFTKTKALPCCSSCGTAYQPAKLLGVRGNYSLCL